MTKRSDVEDNPYDRGYWSRVDGQDLAIESDLRGYAKKQFQRGWRDADAELEAEESGDEPARSVQSEAS